MTPRAQANSIDSPKTSAPARQRILSGNRPTGPLHLGNYLGALQNWVRLQDVYDCRFMVADWHALTSDYADSSRVPEFTRRMVVDWIGAGLDPERSIVFVQSQVKQHAELALLLGMFTPVPWLERTPSFKDMQAQMKDKDLNTHGFLGYPVLQAADILLYKAHVVPVGEDQVAHLELCREIVRRVHHFHQTEIWPEPMPMLSKIPKLRGVDGRKMSKSYDNCIYLSDDDSRIWDKIKDMVTDPARVRRSDPGDPEVCSVFDYHKVFSEADKDRIGADCRTAAIGCVDCKKKLAASLKSLLEPMRERRAAFEARPNAVEEVVADGNARARRIAEATMTEVRETLHLPN
jgi:tryptophanyl-tRNA synthetase